MMTPAPVYPNGSPVETYTVGNTNELQQRIQACSKMQFTGRLDIAINNNPSLQWNLFFYLGYLVGGDSQTHSIRRWCRQLAQHCPQLAATLETNQVEQRQYWEQHALLELVKQKKVSYRQMAAAIEGSLVEILFDVIQLGTQYGEQLGITLTYKPNFRNPYGSRSVLVRTERAWQQASQAWKEWQDADLADWSPNSAPVVWDAETLRRQTSLLVFHNLTKMANGDRTLRDIAIKLKHPIVPLTQSLKPYIQQGIMGLIEIGDLIHESAPPHPAVSRPTSPVSQAPSPSSPPSSAPSFSQSSAQFQAATPSTRPVRVRSSSPLVAYIEDSRFDCITMSRILAQAGYRFINVSEPIHALPILLEKKPDLIFLDLLMPITNGYEVCSQIRRVSAFKDTPVIIVTSIDGIVDRVRAKLAGASGFIAKPIEPERVLSVLRNYVPKNH